MLNEYDFHVGFNESLCNIPLVARQNDVGFVFDSGHNSSSECRIRVLEISHAYARQPNKHHKWFCEYETN